MVKRPANIALAALIVAVGVGFFVATVRSGRADSALLFVVLPVGLAAALALTPGRSTHGRVFRLTTIGLLLAAVALHEGAICVVLAAPLVYTVAHVITALVRRFGRNPALRVLLPIPLLLAGVEGVQPDWRIDPDQSVRVSRDVAIDPIMMPALLAAGPQPQEARPLALRVLGVPTPAHVHGTGLDVGDQWMFGYHGSSHGPGGQIVTEVVDAGPQAVTFAIREDSSITGRWVGMRTATLSWRAGAHGGTRVSLRIDYRRGLDPSWYFGPLQDRFMHAGAEHFLNMLSLP
ncbi:hypothetical protein ACTI_43830 [Actinoplanes sp. OR16]|uniref:hypothetical protein n=1 Tax=Actinoplanes sp. OR16 TaxID=946334 RepID=UPI000F6BD670|nr:hypothetical protein [Actinoplanes sp. OR16]BBH67698.1 hypothetical protein ACTI_43830 [Actinoplanes sp. OR16]